MVLLVAVTTAFLPLCTVVVLWHGDVETDKLLLLDEFEKRTGLDLDGIRTVVGCLAG